MSIEHKRLELMNQLYEDIRVGGVSITFELTPETARLYRLITEELKYNDDLAGAVSIYEEDVGICSRPVDLFTFEDILDAMESNIEPDVAVEMLEYLSVAPTARVENLISNAGFELEGWREDFANTLLYWWKEQVSAE